MANDDSDWAKMTGAELAHILALPDHASALQRALDDAEALADDTDWRVHAAALLTQLNADATYTLQDGTTDKSAPASRLDVLAEEIMRAHFERDDEAD